MTESYILPNSIKLFVSWTTLEGSYQKFYDPNENKDTLLSFIPILKSYLSQKSDNQTVLNRESFQSCSDFRVCTEAHGLMWY